MISFGRSMCADLSSASAREWLETNGLGGFASSTITGANTRRYHGLLTVALRPPVDRYLLLSKLEETLVIGGERYDLATNEYDGAVHPRGFEHQSAFRLDPWPVFTYAVAGVSIEKSVFMLHGSNTTVISYRLISSERDTAVLLEVRPLIAFRDYHSLTHENTAIDAHISQSPNEVGITPYQGLPTLFLAHNAQNVRPEGFWYSRFMYRQERERGLDFNEDLYNPVKLTFELSSRASATLIASTERHDVREAESYRQSERRRRTRVLACSPSTDVLTQTLTAAADQYLVRRGNGYTVIAGYPWFTDWGRDTMIALPGLALYTGQASIARDVLSTFAAHVDMGMLPNRFPDAGEQPEFNTVDATLWFFEAARAYAATTCDYEFIRTELYTTLSSIIDWHIRGTRYGIRMRDSGLLYAGASGAQLTWMDAKIGDWVVTSRHGHPVEIQALWFNALKTMEAFAVQFGCANDEKRFRTISALTQHSFQRLFSNERGGYLNDVVNGRVDDSIRPNQLLAASLHYPLITGERAKSMLAVVEKHLLTPRGLRTLAQGSLNYAGRYEGAPQQRDAVYHQGTVWPWLLGPFVDAYVKAHGGTLESRARAREVLAGMEEHLTEAGLGHISEIFDADAPHQPRGCFAQAWSVGEVLRANAVVHGVEARGGMDSLAATTRP